MLAIHGALRESELLGPKWDDLDLDVGTLAMPRTHSETKEKGHVFEAPMNGKGRRSSSPPGRT